MFVWDLWWSLARCIVYALTLLLGLAAMGCQVKEDVGNLPSYIDPNDKGFQYFEAGPQFQLPNEAAAQNLRRAETQQQQFNH